MSSTVHDPAVPPRKHLWLVGPEQPSATAFAILCHPGLYMKDIRDPYWRGYEDQATVLVADFGKSDLKLSNQLILWGDDYAFNAHMDLPSSRLIKPDLIIVTSQYRPDQVWENSSILSQINRRYKIVEFGDVNNSELDEYCRAPPLASPMPSGYSSLPTLLSPVLQ